MKLVLHCVECGDRCFAPFENEKIHTRALYKEVGWILSVINPVLLVLGPVCGACAKQIYPEVLREFAARQMDKKDN